MSQYDELRACVNAELADASEAAAADALRLHVDGHLRLLELARELRGQGWFDYRGRPRDDLVDLAHRCALDVRAVELAERESQNVVEGATKADVRELAASVGEHREQVEKILQSGAGDVAKVERLSTDVERIEAGQREQGAKLAEVAAQLEKRQTDARKFAYSEMGKAVLARMLRADKRDAAGALQPGQLRRRAFDGCNNKSERTVDNALELAVALGVLRLCGPGKKRRGVYEFGDGWRNVALNQRADAAEHRAQ